MKSLGALLTGSVKRANITRQIDAVRVCSLWDELVRERMGSEFVVYSSALSFQDGVLVVGAATSAVAMELQYSSHAIKNAMTDRLGQAVVSRVQFRVLGELDKA